MYKCINTQFVIFSGRHIINLNIRKFDLLFYVIKNVNLKIKLQFYLINMAAQARFALSTAINKVHYTKLQYGLSNLNKYI